MSHIRVRDLESGYVGRAASASSDGPSQADLTILEGDDFAGKTLDPGEIHCRGMKLCHNQYDRAYERFPEEYLKRFNDTLVGKSVLPGHNYDALPLGRFYTAELTSSMEDMPCPDNSMGRELPEWWWNYYDEDAAPTGSIKDIVPAFVNKRKRVQWCEPSFYFAANDATEPMRQNIDLGVWRHVSIGFRYDDLTCDLCDASYLSYNCPHILGYMDEAGKKVATGTYSGDTQKVEALEGSIVYLGCQPRARLMKAASEGNIDPSQLALTPYGEDLVQLKEAEAWARVYGHKQKSWSMVGIRPKGTTPAPAPKEDLKGGKAGEEAPPVSDPPEEPLDPDCPPGGQTFEARLEAALGAVAGCLKDAREIQQKRAEKGGKFSPARHEQIQEIHQELGELLETTRPMADPSAATEDRARRMRQLRLQVLQDDLANDTEWAAA